MRDDDLLDRVKNLLTLEQDIYAELRAMVSRELEAIVLNRDMEELLAVLQEKQEVISRLQLLADSWQDAVPTLNMGELRGAAGFWEKLASFFPEEEGTEFSAALAATRHAAEDLMKAEKKVQEELENHVRQLREKMLQMNHGRSAFINYAKMGGGYLESNR
ncbi:MAG: flagellar export chaperone FlgN [Synergistaceae bacterium]|nr:flagellar export chaperone FlgN [Synergistaceae bacterium]